MSEKPMRKTEARIAERERARAQRQRSARTKKGLLLVLGGIVLIAVGLGAWMMLNPPTTQGSIGARLQVDRERIELGDQIFDRPARAVFTAKNVGDGTLKLEVPRVPTVLEGC